jgi:hypothetical protein
MQLYTAGKAKFLEGEEWNVSVFHFGKKNGKCAYEYLDKFLKTGIPELCIPPADWSKQVRSSIVKRIINGSRINTACKKQILIESNDDISALWAEIIAHKTGAKHICFNCNEQFRGKNKYYIDYMDFFVFKYARKEILGLRPDSLQRLFEGCIKVPFDENLVFNAVEPEPIQDVNNAIVNNINRLDYNIMYLGRTQKGYFLNIIEGVCEFSKRHNDVKVLFIIVGNADSRLELIKEKTDGIHNLSIILMGDMVPIPSDLYKKIDTVIAGAVSAEISAREGVPTIVADCNNYLANGVLGYTVSNSMYAENQTSQTTFDIALDKVLFERSYLNEEYSFPPEESSERIFDSQFSFFDISDKNKNYYPIETIKSKHRLTIKTKLFLFGCDYFPTLVEKWQLLKKR